jgi:hypothetical protein
MLTLDRSISMISDMQPKDLASFATAFSERLQALVCTLPAQAVTLETGGDRDVLTFTISPGINTQRSLKGRRRPKAALPSKLAELQLRICLPQACIVFSKLARQFLARTSPNRCHTVLLDAYFTRALNWKRTVRGSASGDTSFSDGSSRTGAPSSSPMNPTESGCIRWWAVPNRTEKCFTTNHTAEWSFWKGRYDTAERIRCPITPAFSEFPVVSGGRNDVIIRDEDFV